MPGTSSASRAASARARWPAASGSGFFLILVVQVGGVVEILEHRLRGFLRLVIGAVLGQVPSRFCSGLAAACGCGRGNVSARRSAG
jgi:hypothetical protein